MTRSPLLDPHPGDILAIPAGYEGEGLVTVTRVTKGRVCFHRDGLRGMVGLPRWQREMAGADALVVSVAKEAP